MLNSPWGRSATSWLESPRYADQSPLYRRCRRAAGRFAVSQALPYLVKQHDLHCVITNAENIAGGSGLTPQLYDKLRRYGVDLVTMGDHIYRRQEIIPLLEKSDRIVRPANLAPAAVGRTVAIYETRPGPKVAVVSLLGRLFMKTMSDCPFRAADQVLSQLPRDVKIVVVDMHAEATSEKIAMGWHLDGRVSVVFGTHTHVATADECILPHGTAYNHRRGHDRPVRLGARSAQRPRRAHHDHQPALPLRRGHRRSASLRRAGQCRFRQRAGHAHRAGMRRSRQWPAQRARHGARLMAGPRPIFDPDRMKGGAATPALPKTLTPSQLNAFVKRVLGDHLPGTIHLVGEISNLARPASGHVYLTLKDERSEVRCVMWRSAAQTLKFQLNDGQEVIATGFVDVYEPRGQLQFYAQKIEPRGVGSLELAFRQLRDRLAKEGLFEPGHKKPIPRFPRRLAIVTSATGAALHDILQTLRRRYPCVDVLIDSVRVQGEGAAKEIAAAVNRLNRHSKALGEIDVLIVGRGGGSLEDLWAFNEEVVARAI